MKCMECGNRSNFERRKVISQTIKVVYDDDGNEEKIIKYRESESERIFCLECDSRDVEVSSAYR